MAATMNQMVLLFKTENIIVIVKDYLKTECDCISIHSNCISENIFLENLRQVDRN